MSKLLILIAGLTAFVFSTAAQTHAGAGTPGEKPGAGVAAVGQDSERLEKALQSLTWEQFKAVVSAVPKLKADVDAYGPLGWQYVEANYRTYPWRRNIRKLHEPQKKRLAELISAARNGAGQSD